MQAGRLILERKRADFKMAARRRGFPDQNSADIDNGSRYPRGVWWLRTHDVREVIFSGARYICRERTAAPRWGRRYRLSKIFLNSPTITRRHFCLRKPCPSHPIRRFVSVSDFPLQIFKKMFSFWRIIVGFLIMLRLCSIYLRVWRNQVIKVIQESWHN